jgi:hypothetical protein
MFADRFNGGGFGWDKLTVNHGGPLHGRGIYYCLPALGIAYLIWGWLGFATFAVWFVYRGAFGFGKGTLAPTGHDVIRTLFRHLIPIPAMLLINVGFHVPMWTLVIYGVYAVAATFFAMQFAKALTKPIPEGYDPNDTCEKQRGFAYGVAVALYLLVAGLQCSGCHLG